MKFNFEIKSIVKWYRKTSKEWVLDVCYEGNESFGTLRYSNRNLNKAKKNMFENVFTDIMNIEKEAWSKNIKITDKFEV